MGNKLYVGNISLDTSESDLRDLFTKSGTVISVTIPNDAKTGARQNYGLVEMETPEATLAAIKNANGHQLRGRELKVSEIKIKSTIPRTPHPNSRSRSRSRRRR